MKKTPSMGWSQLSELIIIFMLLMIMAFLFCYMSFFRRFPALDTIEAANGSPRPIVSEFATSEAQNVVKMTINRDILVEKYD